MKYQDFKGALVEAFNVANNIQPPLKATDISFTGAGVWLQGRCNARVTMTARTGNLNLTGSRQVFYNRQRADYGMSGMSIPGKPGDYASTALALTALAKKYSASLYVEDFFSRALTAANKTVLFTPRSDALVWLPIFAIELPFDMT